MSLLHKSMAYGPNTSTVSAEDEAIEYINRRLEKEMKGGSKNAEDVAAAVSKDINSVSSHAREKVSKYVDGIKNSAKGMKVEKLEKGVGGLYNGKDVMIATTTLQVHRSIEETLAQAKETAMHEAYHKKGRHTEKYKTLNHTGDTAVIIGGEELTDEQVVEGLTVAKTGDRFVSDGYKNHKQTLISAVNRAGISLEDVEEALNKKKNLALVDDHARAEQHALAA
jgi:hypothetical protein